MHFHEHVYQKLNALHMFLAGPQFMTYNVHQLLHLRDCVEDLGPLWSHSCFSLKTLMEISVIYFTVHRILMDRYMYIMIVYICVDMNKKVWGK